MVLEVSILWTSFRFGANESTGTVRKTLGVKFLGESRDFRMFLVDVRLEGMPEHGNVSSHQSILQYRG